jgi:hypothetical protein
MRRLTGTVKIAEGIVEGVPNKYLTHKAQTSDRCVDTLSILFYLELLKYRSRFFIIQLYLI